MQGCSCKGAFQGTTPQKAYFVKCDADNNPQSSIELGASSISWSDLRRSIRRNSS